MSGIGRGVPESGTSSPSHVRSRTVTRLSPPTASRNGVPPLVGDDDAIAQRIHVSPNVVAEGGKPSAQSIGVKPDDEGHGGAAVAQARRQQRVQ